MASLLAFIQLLEIQTIKYEYFECIYRMFWKKKHTCNAYNSLNVYTFSVFAENSILKKSVNTLLEEYKTAMNMLNLLKLKAVKQ